MEYLVPKDLQRSFRESPYKLLILLVLADSVFVILDVIAVNTDLIQRGLFLMDNDDSYAEVYQYIKEFWIVLILFYLFLKKPSYLLLSWCLVFGYIFVDDAFALHERMGGVFTVYFGFNDSYGLPSYQFGELVYATLVGVCILFILGSSYLLSNKRFRRVSNSLLFLFLLFIFISLFIDIVHELVRQTVLGGVFTVIEEGGEMVVISLTTWYVFYLKPETI